MKYINKSLRELCGNNIDKTKFAEHLKNKKSSTVNLIGKYIKKGEMVQFDYPFDGFGWVVHKSAFDIVIRDLEKERNDDPENYSEWRINIQIDKLEDQKLNLKEMSDKEHDDMMWGGVAYYSMRFVDGDAPDPRKDLN